MIAVTIAVGSSYVRRAEVAAESVRKHTGLEAIIVRDPNPNYPSAFGKMRLLERFDCPIFYFDADTVMVRPWDPSEIQQFSASLDFKSRARDMDCSRYNILPGLYFNTGVMIMLPEHKPVMLEALEIAISPSYRTAFRFEQTAINVAVQRSGIEVNYLPRKYNAMCRQGRPMPGDAVILHAAGGCDMDRMMSMARKAELGRHT
jgi:hypothetical protein